MDADRSGDSAPATNMADAAPLPSFHFPAMPAPAETPSHGHRRNASMFMDSTSHQRVASLERKSASALPTFSFNASDTSGRTDSPPSMSFLDTPTSAGRSGHRRGASEYIGGTSRHGLPGLVSVTPVKQLGSDAAIDSAYSGGSPMRKKGHSHRRSTAMSMHDVQSILQPRDANIVPPFQQGDFSFPKPPQAEMPSVPAPEPVVIVEDAQSQAVPRPRVGFSTNVEFIPRPLSTISSETESSISVSGPAAFGASSSPLRSAQNSSPAKRKSTSAYSNLSEVEFAPSSASPEHSATVGPGSSDVAMIDSTNVAATLPESIADHLDFSLPPRKKATKLDRRKSEPLLSTTSSPKPKRSSISLREPMIISASADTVPPVPTALPAIIRKSSASRVKAWASSVVSRKDKKKSKQRLTSLGMGDSAVEGSASPVMGPEEDLPSSNEVTPHSEPDLEELFASDPFGQHDDEPAPTSVFTYADKTNLTDFRPTYDTSEDTGLVIDLDAAMEPSKTPSKSPSFGARRQLHSSRTNRDFNSPSNLFHRRAESAPVLASFDYPKSPSPQHSPMADVFEEEEEDEAAVPETKMELASTPTPVSLPPTEFADDSADRAVSRDSTDDGLGIHHPSAMPPTPSSQPNYSRLPLTDDMIIEELGPIEIVEAHEEPRASMITKSSDSSETPTLMAEPVLEPLVTNLAPPQAAFMAPSLYTESTVSTPDTTWRQSSFDTSRVGTSASSTTDCRTLSSHADDTRDNTRVSVDDVPSLVSGRSRRNTGRQSLQRNVSGTTAESSASAPAPPALPTTEIPRIETAAEERRKKRNSIASLTKLVTSPFSQSRNQLNLMEQGNASSPNLLSAASASSSSRGGGGKKKERRLSKLMFWKHKGSH